MPHECTNCGRTFADGSKEMLSGCPDCGGNKFQFRPSGSSQDETKATESAGASANAAPTADSAGGSGTVGRAANTVKGWVGSRGRSESESTNSDRNEPAQKPTQPTNRREQPPKASERAEANESAVANEAAQSKPTRKPTAEPSIESTEDRAQASARSEIVPDDELPERPDNEGTGTVIKPPEDNQPSLDELREELNSQFESIKVVEPGQYELNLMELYERDEYIIAMRENGRYVIQVPDSWTGAADS
ncbi:hypothetical protein ZOD2009_17910 [Haladaptatus paucihalophilus DX253]|uniref:Zn-ribbon containing protein n=1 Tax=Haladaptatus paucihalophilus DX253 TaxID=797209 RepID=E7QXP3_HALPU|nr:Zn-ribbon containing protein [Haladaptatus paucihalophilus]EFW90594.1 hypothetical protein ZOD2009_17910 [Haladaptatus paucihalophilus DX253]SHL57676.1 hypothetical protein SAMN05444342_4175 [Haladaptatus paucihalophilus DX253]